MIKENTLGGLVYFVYNEEYKTSGRNAVLMIHGHGGDHQGLEEIAKQLKTVVVVPDLPGFGASEEIAVHTVEAYVEKLNELMDALGYGSYDVIGHSFGAALALLLAVTYKKTKRMLLVNSAPQLSMPLKNLSLGVHRAIARLPEKYKHGLVHADWYSAAGFFVASGKRYSPEKMKSYVVGQRTMNYSFKTWSESMESIYSLDQSELAKKCAIPVVLLHGDKDLLVPAKSIIALHSKFPSAILIRTPKAGHFMPIENADEVVSRALSLFKQN